MFTSTPFEEPHDCWLHCLRPACVLHQRDQLREAYERLLDQTRELRQLLRAAEHSRPPVRLAHRIDLHKRPGRPAGSPPAPPSNVVELDP